jgi:flagellar FliJ protein
MERPVNSDRHFAFRETQKLDRLTAFRTDSARRMTSQIERIIADFNRAINDLNRAIEAEHIRTHIDDPDHFAYSTAAKAMAQRRSNLVQSIDQLKHQLAAATPPRFQPEQQIPAVASAISL